MAKKIVISKDRTSQVSVREADTTFIVNKAVALSTSGMAIAATGNATGRDFYVNGIVTSKTDYVFRFGSTSLVDSKSEFVVSTSGRMTGGEYGLRLDGGGMQLGNSGTIEARLGAIMVNGAATQIVNSGFLASTQANALSITGAKAEIINHGTIEAGLRGVSGNASGLRLTNNGEIRSTGSDGISSSGSVAILTNHGTVKAKAAAILSSGKAAIVTNDGLVQSTGGDAIVARGFDATVTNSGTIKSAKIGIALSGDSGIVTNDGSITASGYGVSVKADDALVTNNKTIRAGGGVIVDGDKATVSNLGTIAGTSTSLPTIDFSDATKSTLKNSGLITAKSIAFLGGDGVQSVFNSGTITGSIKLGGGNDYFDGTGGKVTGTVNGGSGDDVYVISDASIRLSEPGNGGIDLVKSSVSFTLGNNFENLTLTGTAAISATGNGMANQLHGNSGSNTINGMGGNDIIWGHAGADILTGGSGADQFVFNTGDGKDTITDFTATGSSHDIIDFSGMASITSFSDLVRNHMTQVGNDVFIDALNGDSVLLKNVKLASLDAGDFLF